MNGSDSLSRTSGSPASQGSPPPMTLPEMHRFQGPPSLPPPMQMPYMNGGHFQWGGGYPPMTHQNETTGSGYSQQQPQNGGTSLPNAGSGYMAPPAPGSGYYHPNMPFMMQIPPPTSCHSSAMTATSQSASVSPTDGSLATPMTAHSNQPSPVNLTQQHQQHPQVIEPITHIKSELVTADAAYTVPQPVAIAPQGVTSSAVQQQQADVMAAAWLHTQPGVYPYASQGGVVEHDPIDKSPATGEESGTPGDGSTEAMPALQTL